MPETNQAKTIADYQSENAALRNDLSILSTLSMDLAGLMGEAVGRTTSETEDLCAAIGQANGNQITTQMLLSAFEAKMKSVAYLNATMSLLHKVLKENGDRIIKYHPRAPEIKEHIEKFHAGYEKLKK